MCSKDKIKMYGLSTCFHCKSLINFLKDQQLRFEIVNIDELQGMQRKEMIAEVKRFNQRCTFPTTVIGEQVVVGFKEDELRDAIGIEE